MAQKYYAVRKGYVPGIYTSQADLTKQIKGYSYPEYKTFKSFDAAEKYMNGTSAAEGPAKKKAPTKYYAVRKGRKTGIFETHKEYEAACDKYPGYECKSFKTLEEARQYMRGIDPGKPAPDAEAGSPKTCNFETKYISEKHPVDPRFQPESLALAISNAASAYVDGSYYPTDDTCSYGVVLLHYDYEMHIRGRVADPYCKTNATSEIQAVMAAVMFCVTHGIRKLIIHYDFAAARSWLKSGGDELGENYRAFMERAAYAVSVTFHKVPAHAGIYGNELADELARQAQKL